MIDDNKREQIKEYVRKEDCVRRVVGVIGGLLVQYDISIEESREITIEVIDEYLNSLNMEKIAEGLRQFIEFMNNSWENAKNDD